MAALLSRILTATTVLLLAAVLLITVVDGVIEANLGAWTMPLVAVLGALVLIRLPLNARSLRSRAAAPVMDSAAVQSGLLGLKPGSSRIEQAGGPTHTTSLVDQDPRRDSGTDPHDAGVEGKET